MVDDDNLWSKDTVFVTIFPAPVNLVINEFMIYTADLDDELGEYIEIINLGSEPVDLRSYTLYGSEGESHFINDADPVLVEPQDYFILGVSDDWSEWTEIVSGADYVYPFLEFSMMDFETADEEELDEFTDVIGLLSRFDQVIDEVVYSSGWDVVEEAEGLSIELTHPTLDNSLEEAWLNADEDVAEYSEDYGLSGTPGSQNSVFQEDIGVTYYVSTSGSDSNDGSAGSPFATIQAGIDAASDGDTVLVAAGTYIENINFNGKNIVVQGEDRETTIIDGGQNGSVVTFENVESGLLDGFTIQNGRDYGGGGILINSSASLKNLIIKDNRSSGKGAGIRIDGGNSTIDASIIRENTSGGGGGGIALLGGSVVVKNSLIINKILSKENNLNILIYHRECNLNKIS